MILQPRLSVELLLQVRGSTVHHRQQYEDGSSEEDHAESDQFLRLPVPQLDEGSVEQVELISDARAAEMFDGIFGQVAHNPSVINRQEISLASFTDRVLQIVGTPGKIII